MNLTLLFLISAVYAVIFEISSSYFRGFYLFVFAFEFILFFYLPFKFKLLNASLAFLMSNLFMLFLLFFVYGWHALSFLLIAHNIIYTGLLTVVCYFGYEKTLQQIHRF